MSTHEATTPYSTYWFRRVGALASDLDEVGHDRSDRWLVNFTSIKFNSGRQSYFVCGVKFLTHVFILPVYGMIKNITNVQLYYKTYIT